MHVQAAHQVPVSLKRASLAVPLPALGPLFETAFRTPAGGSPLVAGEAHDAALLTLVREIVNILPIFPAAHSLVMVATGLVVAHAVGVADKERPDAFPHAEINHPAGAFVPQIADLPFGAGGDAGAGALEFPPAARTFGAS